MDSANDSDEYAILLEDSLRESKVLRLELKQRDEKTSRLLRDLSNRVDELAGVLKEPSSKRQRERNRSKTIVPRLCRTKCRNMYKKLLKDKKITGFDLTEGKLSSTNEGVIIAVSQAVRLDNGGDTCAWSNDQMRESLFTYFRTLKDDSKRNPDVERNVQCRRLGRVKEKVERRSLALKHIDKWNDTIKKRISKTMQRDYTSSDESGTEEDDESGRRYKIFLTKRLRWQSPQLTDIKEILDEFYRSNVRGAQIKRKYHAKFSTRQKPDNAVVWAVQKPIATSTPKNK